MYLCYLVKITTTTRLWGVGVSRLPISPRTPSSVLALRAMLPCMLRALLFSFFLTVYELFSFFTSQIKIST